MDNLFKQTDIARPTRLLVVEDDRHTARFLKFILRKEGYHVTLAENGEQALRVIESARFDALLLDLVLPGISGLDALRRIRADDRNSDLIVLILTARSFEETPEEIILAGADSHCPKPVAPTMLLRKLADLGVSPGGDQASEGREYRQMMTV
jgi:DNA-binding response OmpR family regulator